MIEGEEYTFYIGLLKSDMKSKLKESTVLNAVVKELRKIKVLGFNTERDVKRIKGFWNGKPEQALKCSFINTFKVNDGQVERVAKRLSRGLSQEAILTTKKPVNYGFN